MIVIKRHDIPAWAGFNRFRTRSFTTHEDRMTSKRSALKAMVGTAALAAFAGLVPGLRNAVAQTLKVRRCINAMPLDDPDLETYRDFVGIMRARPDYDPISWINFADQHGRLEGFKYCPHGSWFFLPWHRAFVLMYERAAAAHTGNTSFAMPYWDWTSLRDYPLAFTQKKYKDRLNPLYAPNLDDAPQARRRPLQGRNALNDSQVGQAVMEQVYAETVFEAFGTSRPTDRSVTPPLPQSDLHPRWATMGGGNQGVLERTPHNAVHNNIGGYMPTGASVRDPIFMVHHCNVDRIWARWNALGRENSADPLWLNMRFVDNFIDPWGRRYSATVKELLDIAALGYSYDDMPGPDGVKPDRQRSARFAALLDPASNIPRARAEGRTSAMPDQAWSANAPMDGDFTSALSAPQEQRSIVAVISDIVMGEGVPSIRVFVNRQTVGLEVPDTDPHFVTTLSFLAHAAGAHAHHGTHTAALPSTIVDLTPTLRRLAVQGKLLGDTITVQLLAVPDPDTQVRSSVDVKAGAIEIAVI